MPNWCYSSHVVTGDKAELRDLYEKMKSLEERESSLVENGFGKTWLGNLVTLLGGDWKCVYCRGYFDTLEIDNDNVEIRFNVCHAWSEPYEVVDFLKAKFNNLEFYYMAEECGMEHFVTNDASGKYFPERYYFSEQDSCESHYYTESEFNDFLSDVGKFVGKDIKSVEEAFKEIDEYNNSVDYDNYAEVRIYQVVE